MKRTVTVTMEIDPVDYHLVEDTPEGTIDLVIDMLRGDADLPDQVIVACEYVKTLANLSNALDSDDGLCASD